MLVRLHFCLLLFGVCFDREAAISLVCKVQWIMAISARKGGGPNTKFYESSDTLTDNRRKRAQLIKQQPIGKAVAGKLIIGICWEP